jgi:hypothetical protein
MRISSQNLTLAALFMALGVLIPLVFHHAGLGPLLGQILLPMFWPIAVGSFFLPFGLAIVVGLSVPLLSALFSGMPPVPLLYIMPLELALMAGIIQQIYTRTSWGVFRSLLTGLAVTRLAYLLYAAVLSPLLGVSSRMITSVAVIYGIPGMAAMLILIPLILRRLPGHTNVSGGIA